MIDTDVERRRAAALGAFTDEQLLELVPGAIAVSAQVGIDIRDKVRQCIAMARPALFARALGRSPNTSTTNRDDEIERLYRVLAELERDGDETTYRKVFRRLRALQSAEADRMSKFFEANQSFSIEGHRRTRERSERLLAKHEDAAATHRPRRRSHR